METAIGARLPEPKILPPSLRERSPDVRWLPRKWKIYRLENSSTKHLRKPSAELESKKPALVTKPMMPLLPMRSLAQRMARI